MFIEGGLIHSDLSQRAVVFSDDLPWVDSPAKGVQRKLLERDGGEVARATSIVRFEARSEFSEHAHRLGEEIIVLDGELLDESGTYRAGTYLKNPPGSAHSTSTLTGCTLLVKLRHLDLNDRKRVVIDTRSAMWHPGLVQGLSVMPLSEFEGRNTALVRWAPKTQFNPHRHFGGEEIYVLEGVFEDEHGRYPKGTWIRSPHLSMHRPFSNEGCTIFVKTGHLFTQGSPSEIA